MLDLVSNLLLSSDNVFLQVGVQHSDVWSPLVDQGWKPCNKSADTPGECTVKASYYKATIRRTLLSWGKKLFKTFCWELYVLKFKHWSGL